MGRIQQLDGLLGAGRVVAVARDLDLVAASALAVVAAVFLAFRDRTVAGLMGALAGLIVCHDFTSSIVDEGHGNRVVLTQVNAGARRTTLAVTGGAALWTTR